MSDLYVLTGLPCSGKTYLTRSMTPLIKGHFRAISPPNDPANLQDAYAAVGNWLHSSGETLVFDFGLNTRVARTPLVSIARGAGMRVRSIYVRTPVNFCLDRDTKNKYTQQYIISQSSFLDPPSIDEGFTSVHVYNATTLDSLKLFLDELFSA